MKKIDIPEVFSPTNQQKTESSMLELNFSSRISMFIIYLRRPSGLRATQTGDFDLKSEVLA